MSIKQEAGDMQVELFTDGWPFQAYVSLAVDMDRVRLSVSDLHDLRYCIDRILAQAPATK